MKLQPASMLTQELSRFAQHVVLQRKNSNVAKQAVSIFSILKALILYENMLKPFFRPSKAYMS